MKRVFHYLCRCGAHASQVTAEETVANAAVIAKGWRLSGQSWQCHRCQMPPAEPVRLKPAPCPAEPDRSAEFAADTDVAALKADIDRLRAEVNELNAKLGSAVQPVLAEMFHRMAAIERRYGRTAK